MKTVKRNFLVVDENIRLTYMNDYKVTRYFNPSYFNIDGYLTLHFENVEEKELKSIIVK